MNGTSGCATLVDAGVEDAGVLLDGRCFAYVFPCRWEDHCKIGFSRDPLARIAALHRRWFEFFDLERGCLVEAESVRDARDLELGLRAGLREYSAPAPQAMQASAGGGSEWFRGVQSLLRGRVEALAEEGYRTWPLKAWLRAAMHLRRDGLHEWALAQWPADGMGGQGDDPAMARARRDLQDTLDAYVALRLEPERHLPEPILAWYRPA